jgi:serine/threonine protein kinase
LSVIEMNDNSTRKFINPFLLYNQQFKYDIIEELDCSKVPVLVVSSKDTHEQFAMKLYPCSEGRIHKSYRNEAKFKSLDHCNIISFIENQDSVNIPMKGKSIDASYIVMELAPFGDFSTLLRLTNFSRDESLVRTYFHQLIEGIEYLHSKRVFHLDIKPDNILLGADLKLKIADFDSSYNGSESPIRSRGTRNYRAPEVKESRVLNPAASDVFSAAITLFVMKTDCFAYMENEIVEGYALDQMLLNQDPKFWEAHKKILGERALFSSDFKNLIFSMVKSNPSERATISQIKKSSWYRGPTYSNKELCAKVTKMMKDAGILEQ